MGQKQTGGICAQETLNRSANTIFLGREFPVIPLPLRSVFGSEGDFYVEVGFGNGEFLCHLAAQHPECLYLGIEWSFKSVEKAKQRIMRLGLSNIRLVLEDARIAVPFLIEDGCVKGFYFNFPDPWFKRRHKKHRLFTLSALRAYHCKLVPGGFIEVATDWAEYAYWIVEQVLMSRLFQPLYPEPFFVNFLPGRFYTKYERIHHLLHGDPVYYMKFVKS